jgi:hypothetical protein
MKILKNIASGKIELSYKQSKKYISEALAPVQKVLI